MPFPQAVIPVPPAGFGPQPADMTALVQAPVGFCSQMPVFRGIQHGAGQALTGSAFNPLSLDPANSDILEDPYTGWSHVATSAQPANSYLVPYTGFYEVLCTTITAAGAAVWLQAGVQVSGGTVEYMDSELSAGGFAGGCHASLIIPCTGGIDYIQAGCQPSAGVTTSTTNQLRPSLEIIYRSSG